MPKKKPDKKIFSLEPVFKDILVCNKKEYRPFLETLVEKPENISRQNLGVLFGIFQIDDRSEDSSYVVNYLISIIKKEYFSRVNRGAVENFEATLRKANLALAKLAAHENIGWIGKINAVCAVIEKNNLLLSQTGNISAFLLRGSNVTEITENSADAADSNPLKTFQDIISGKIEKTDKLIFSTKEIFDIFSLEEIKKSALKFSTEDFVRFLNTALVNELDNTAALIIAIDEKEIADIAALPEKKTQKINAFSQMAFRKKTSRDNIEKAEKIETARENPPAEKTREIIKKPEKNKDDFIDKKTGHIYIKDDTVFLAKTYDKKDSFDFSFFAKTAEKISALFSGVFLSAKNYWISKKNKLRISFISQKQKWKMKSAQKKADRENQMARLEKEILPTMPEDPAKKELRDTLRAKPLTNSAYRDLFRKIKVFFQTLAPEDKLEWLGEKIIDGAVILLRIPLRGLALLFAFDKSRWLNYRNNKSKKNINRNNTVQNNVLENSSVISVASTISAVPATPAISTTLPNKLNNFLPDFSRLKQLAGKLNYQQRLYAVIIIFLLLIVPYWIAKWENKPEEAKVEIVEKTPLVPPLAQDKNVTQVEKTSEVYAGNIKNILNLNDKFFALAENKIIDLENKKSFPIPQDFQNPELFLGMNDLSLIFLVKNNQIISLAPTTGKFQPGALAFPENGKIADGKTYLTYLYLLNQKNNQIYRYPRAEGGFGEKTNWLKEALDLSGARNMAINENIFILDGKNIIKLFRGKKQEFSIENTATKILAEKLYTERKLSNLYVLDKINARIIKLDNDGKILAQYYNPDIADATDFSVGEENNLIYISNEKGVKSFGMRE
ncbi:MAG TPA: hypothetical protein DCS28_04185 [Candidatus Moranbacteria bacterium]|nr:hypothetical protein [Candidatus Moranbacteria bacterium]HAT75208.1 hypothetical protein [Candidatus Moranbacteria bacterium]